MANKIQIRRDTAANWTSANPILASGEFGFETDTKKKKIGDGITTWNALGYDIGEISSPVTSNPVENTYVDIIALLADQSNQTESYFQYVVDASTDPNVSSGDAYYEKLAGSTAALIDYRLLSDSEVTIVQGNNGWRVFKIQSINDDTTPLTSVQTGKIGIDYNTTSGKVTSILFSRQFSDTIVNITALSNLKLRLYNQNSGVIEVTSITSFTTVGNYIRANVGSEITASDLSVNNKLEVYFDEAGGSSAVDSVNGATGTVVLSQEDISGTRLTASVSTATYNIDLSSYSDFNLTLTVATTIGDTNRPTGTATKIISGIITGDYALSFDADYTVEGDTYDGTVDNLVTIYYLNGTASSEKIIVDIRNLS